MDESIIAGGQQLFVDEMSRSNLVFSRRLLFVFSPLDGAIHCHVIYSTVSSNSPTLQ